MKAARLTKELAFVGRVADVRSEAPRTMQVKDLFTFSEVVFLWSDLTNNSITEF